MPESYPLRLVNAAAVSSAVLSAARIASRPHSRRAASVSPSGRSMTMSSTSFCVPMSQTAQTFGWLSRYGARAPRQETLASRGICGAFRDDDTHPDLNRKYAYRRQFVPPAASRRRQSSA